MGYLTTGINHTTAPVSLREKVAFSRDQLADALQQACRYIQIREIVILSTCNRTELYCPDTVAATKVLQWLTDYHHVSLDEVSAHAYVYRNTDAIRHIMRVACGLDSMILGEPQILGQLKSAYFQAQAVGTTGILLNRLFQQSFATAKQVRSQTTIGKLPVSVAYAATHLAKQIFTDLSKNTALLIGAGKTVQLVARHLKQQGLDDIIIANRTLEKAKRLTDELGGQPILLSALPVVIKQADIVITSTASQTPVLGKGCVEKALKARKHRPIFMVDIAVPRDIEPEVEELPDVFLYTVDDLHNVIEGNLQQRKASVELAEALIEASLTDFMTQMRSLDAVNLLRSYRQKSEHLRKQEVQRAMQELSRGVSPESVLNRMASALTNKMTHTPSIQLKKAAASGQHERLEWAKELLDLNDESDNASPSKRAKATKHLSDS
ncbi:MAG: glutamyl-tRNA reductase [Endozoicomonas sp. (ex Botrylloides leachii)]|nr:glutamyl-tRNA reductase [Endozoicomonas sp. (ex Botrylloides leachii)]